MLAPEIISTAIPSASTMPLAVASAVPSTWPWGRKGCCLCYSGAWLCKKNLAVKICNVDEEFFGDFGTYGTGPGQWVWPAGIAADSQQRLYVSDEWNQRITVFDKQGNLLDEWGEEGAGEGQLNRPSGLAFDAEEHLLVVDAYNHRIQKFTKDGKFLSGWGSYGTGPGQFNLPWGVAVNAADEVYVTDWRNDRVQKFGPQGEFLLQWGSAGSGEGEFDRPVGIAVDRDGDVYVVDWHNHRVQIFDSGGGYQAQLTGDANLSSWAEQLLARHEVILFAVAPFHDRAEGVPAPDLGD